MPKKEVSITRKYLPPSLLGWCKEGVVLRENILFLNHLCLASHRRDTGKQCGLIRYTQFALSTYRILPFISSSKVNKCVFNGW